MLLPFRAGTRLPTQLPCWLESACRYLGRAAEVVRFNVRGNGWDGWSQAAHPASMPLVRMGAHQVLTPPGATQTGEPTDLAWTDPDSLEHLADQLARQSRPLDLPRVPLGSPSVEALGRAFQGRGWVRVHETLSSPCIELGERWTEPRGQFNARRQSDFRRAHKRAKEAGEVRFEVHAPTPGPALDRWLNEAYAVESKGWKGAGGTALASDPQLGPFYRGLSNAAAREGLLRLCFLRIGGQPAAMQLALQYGRRFWLMKIGYDPAYARCSPGQLLMLHTIGHAAGLGLASYEMLGNTARWTADWTTTLRPFVRLRAYPASWRSVLAASAETSHAALSRWRNWRVSRQAPPVPSAQESTGSTA